jgi:hypothetical protein
MRRSLLAILLIPILALTGCSNFSKAQTVYTVVDIAVNLAKGELPLLVTAGVLPQSDETAILSYVTVAGTFNSNYEACITNAQNSMLSTSGKFKDCLGVFATSLSDPKTLAGLHVVSSKGQSKAQGYIAAIVAGVNIGLDAFKAGQVATPVVAPITAETINDTNQFRASVISHLPSNLRMANGY